MSTSLKLKDINSRSHIFCSIHGANNVSYGVPMKAKNLRELVDNIFSQSNLINLKKVNNNNISKITIRNVAF
jgi:hypothetical protein